MKHTYREDDAGYLNDYPEKSIRGLSLPELEKALVDVYKTRQEEKKYMAEIRKMGTIPISA